MPCVRQTHGRNRIKTGKLKVMLSFDKKADMAFRAGFFLYVVQLVLIFVSTLWLLPTHKTPNLTAAIFISLPLLILLPWLLRRNIRAFVWLCFMQLGYFMPATQHMFMVEQYGWIPFVETAVIVTLFVVAMLFARWEQKRFGISVTR
jgi:uncharacterized membrane protein